MKRNKYIGPLAKMIEISTMTVIADSIKIEDDDNRGGSSSGPVMSNKQQGAWGDVWSK